MSRKLKIYNDGGTMKVQLIQKSEDELITFSGPNQCYEHLRINDIEFFGFSDLEIQELIWGRSL